MSQLTHGALFNGIAGFALAARWAGIRTTWTCEIDPFCNAVSRKHFPDAHQYHDIHHVHHPERVDIISGGYPCQPESYAGKRRSQADGRWLWPQMLRLVDQVRPGWVLGENVAGHVGLGLSSVLSDLEATGYEVWPLIIPACGLDATHQRERVWIIAHANDRQPVRPQQTLRPGWDAAGLGCEVTADPNSLRWGAHIGNLWSGQSNSGGSGQAAAHPDCERRCEPNGQSIAHGQGQGPGLNGHLNEAAAHSNHLEWRQQQQQRSSQGAGARHEPDWRAEAVRRLGWLFTEPALRARNDGLPGGLVRHDGGGDEANPKAAQGEPQKDPRHWARNTLRAAGNALVPQIPTLFFQFIADYEAGLIHPNQ